MRQEIDSLQCSYKDLREGNDRISALVDDVMSSNLQLERKCLEELKETDGVGKESGQTKFQYPASQDSTLAKTDQRLLCSISANSSSLVEMTARNNGSEMVRTRRIDSVLEELEHKTNHRMQLMDEICTLSSQLQEIRKEYDSQLIDDFHVLIDLAQTVESLEAELGRERKDRKVTSRRKAHGVYKDSSEVVVPIRESTIQLQEEVFALTQELEARESFFKTELEKATRELTALKSHKVKTKSSFQQSLKSLFKDMEVLRERLDRSEATLEKINGHYQIEEDEIVTIVSPIIESIDGVRERVDLLTMEAEKALYGDEENNSK